jgi:DNA-directed RNA polymerase specialized sigma24 family protein
LAVVFCDKNQSYSCILRILKQEVFIKIYHNFERYNSKKAKPLTWVATIACNYTIDFYRKKQLPITDDFDLSVINDGQIQLPEKFMTHRISKQVFSLVRVRVTQLLIVLSDLLKLLAICA